ncbi:MAG: SpoIID/LytB domain-containing protein [Thermoleophilaceae bacterium]|nr:SpoIID/LytB domain-containing protein [Thermoleophilaceae bacterium]
MRRVVLLTALLALLAAPPAGAATRHVVSGAGFGHGIGMSQYGAYGFAQNGVGYVRILKHYYKGTQIGRAPSRPVRVLLQASDPYVRFSGATRVGGKRISRGLHIVRPAGGGRLRVSGAGTFSGPISVTGNRPIRLMGPAINGIDSGTYRGAMVLRPGAIGGVTAINSLPIDTYLGGVVPGEMPSSWDYDALRAQAVAARTYALATRQRGQVFDLYPDTRSQVYAGVSAETSRTNKAVADTARQVLTYDGDPVTTFYFSTSGGRTENVELSFLGAQPQPYLESVRDPYDDISPRHRWQFRFSRSELGARLGAPGTLRRVDVLRRGNSPRIVRARVVGSRGSRMLSGADIRARLDLYDSWAFFRKVSTSQVAQRARGARDARGSFPEIAGVFAPAPRSRRVLVERRSGNTWARVSRIRTSRKGRYRTTVGITGVYRVRVGSVAGPAVRVR